MIGATFNTTGAIKQLTNFITEVNKQAALASTKVLSSLASQTAAGKDAVPVAALSGQLDKVSSLSKDSAKATNDAYKNAAKESKTVLANATKEIGKYGKALGRVSTGWNTGVGAMIRYMTTHTRILATLTGEVEAYGATIVAVSAKLGITNAQLANSLAGIAKSSQVGAQGAVEQAAATAKGTKEIVKQRNTQEEINRAANRGATELNKRITSAKTESRLLGEVLTKQREQADNFKRATRNRQDDIQSLKRQQKLEGKSVASQNRINVLTNSRNRNLKLLANKQRQILETQQRQAKVTADISRQTGTITKRMLFAAASLAQVVKRVILWSAGIGLIFGTLQKINQAFSDSISLQDKMVQIAKIRPFDFDVEPLRESAIATAVKYGIELKSISETMRVFAQQGKSTSDIITLIDIASKGVVATNLTMNDSVQLLTATMNIFKLTVEETESVLDKIQSVQANYAVTAEDLSHAMRLLGPIVRVLGSDMDFLLGSVTAVAEATRQTGKFVGNALKTIFARLPKKDSLFILNSIGVSLYELDGALRPLDKILGDTAKRWGGLTDAAKLNLATTVGGIRRYNVFITLMENFDRVVAASETSMSALGSAQDAVVKEQQSLQRRLNITRETFRNVGIEVTKGLAPVLVNLSELLAFIVNKWTVFGAAALGGAAALYKLGKAVLGLNAVQRFITAASVSTTVFNAVLKDSVAWMARAARGHLTLAGAFRGTAIAAGAAGGAVKGFLIATGAALLPLVAIGAAIYTASKAWQGYKRNVEESNRLQDEMVAASKRFKSIGLNLDAFENLPDTIGKSNEEIARFLGKLSEVGIVSSTVAGAVSRLDSSLLLFVKGFSTTETIKQLKNAEGAVSSLGKEMRKAFGQMADKNEGFFERIGFGGAEGFWRGFIDDLEKQGLSGTEIKQLFERIINGASEGMDLDDPTRKVFEAFSEGLTVVGRDIYLNYEKIGKAAEQAGPSLGKSGRLTKFVQLSQEELTKALAKRIVLEEDTQRTVERSIKIGETHVDVINEIIRAAIEENRIRGQANSTFTKSLKTLLAYRSVLDKVGTQESKQAALLEDQDKFLLKLNRTYQGLRNTLDEIEYKYRVQNDVNKLLGLGIDESANAIKKAKDLFTEYIKVLDSVELTEAQLARNDTLATRIAILSDRTKDAVKGFQKLDEYGTKEIFDDIQSASQKVSQEAVKSAQKLTELSQAWRQILTDMGQGGEIILNYVDGITKAGIVTDDWGTKLQKAFSNLHKGNKELVAAAAAGRFISKPFSLVEKSLENATQQIREFRDAIARIPEGSVDITDRLVSGEEKYRSKISEIQQELKNVNLAESDRIALTAKLTKYQERIAIIQRKIFENNTQNFASTLLTAESQAELNKALGEYEEIQNRILSNFKLSAKLTAKQVALEAQAQAAQVQTSEQLKRFSTTNLRTIQLTNKLYDQRRDSIVAGTLALADADRIERAASGTAIKSQELAIQLAQKKQLLIYENEAARLAALRKLAEGSITAQYKLQQEEIKAVGSEIEKYFTSIGSLLADPIKKSVALASSLSFKIRSNNKLFDIQHDTLEAIYNAQLENVVALRKQGEITDDFVNSEKERLKTQFKIKLEIIDQQRAISNAKVEYEDHINQLNKTVEVYKSIRSAIVGTATDFDKLVSDAHVFRDLFDEIGNIFYKRGIENIFDKIFETSDDNVAKLLQDGFLEAKVKLLIETGGFTRVSQEISNGFALERQELTNHINAVTSKIAELEPVVLTTTTAIVNGLVDKLKVVYETAAGTAQQQIDRIAEGKYDVVEASVTMQDSAVKFLEAGNTVQTEVGRLISSVSDLSVVIGKAAIGYKGSTRDQARAARDIASSKDDAKTLIREGTGVNVLSFSTVAINDFKEALLKSGLVQAAKDGIPDPNLPRDTGDAVKTVFSDKRFQSGVALATLGLSQVSGGNTGRGLASGIGTASAVGSLIPKLGELGGGLPLAIAGGLIGAVTGFQRDKQEEGRKAAEERRREEERRKREIEAARDRAAILDAAERIVSNTGGLTADTLFAPTGFRIPSYALRGGALPGGQNTFNVTVPLGAEARNVASEISKHVDGNYSDESYRQSSNSDSYI